MKKFRTLAVCAMLLTLASACFAQDVPPTPTDDSPPVPMTVAPTPAPAVPTESPAAPTPTPTGLTDAQKADVKTAFDGLFNSQEFEKQLDAKVGALVPGHVKAALEQQLPGALAIELGKQLPGAIGSEVTRQLPGAIAPLKKEFAGAATEAMLPAVENMLVGKGVLRKQADGTASPSSGTPVASTVTNVAPAPVTKKREPVWNTLGFIDENGKQWYKGSGNNYYETPQGSYGQPATCNSRNGNCNEGVIYYQSR